MALYDNLSATVNAWQEMQTNEQFISCMQQTNSTPTDSYRKIIVKLAKTGSPNVDIKGVVMSGPVVTPGSGDTMTIDACSDNSVNSSTITTSYEDYEFNFTDSHDLGSGAQFGIGIVTNTSSDNSNYVKVGLHNGVVSDYQVGRASGSVLTCSGTRSMYYSHPSGYSQVMKLEDSAPPPGPSGDGGRLPPPPINLVRF